MYDGPATGWREVVNRHHSALVDELSSALDSEVQAAISHAVAAERFEASSQLVRACDEARRQQSESLNQAIRRLREASNEDEVLTLLGQSCSPWAGRSVVLVFENNRARVAAVQDTGDEAIGAEITGISLDITEAPAIVSVAESRDPVVSIASPAQLSPVLAAAFEPKSAEGGQPDPTGPHKSYLFPLTVRQSVAAVLIAGGAVVPAPIELLCEAAGMKFEALLPFPAQPAAAPPSAAEELVQLESAASASAPADEAISVTESSAGPSTADRGSGFPAWEVLDYEDQRLHLQAQRMSRVSVAGMRVYHGEALAQGLAESNVYGALRAAIDAARSEFLQRFLSSSHTMIDYLHVEIVRNLVHDDERLLGRDYPGPMA